MGLVLSPFRLHFLQVVARDEDGISLYFFSSGYKVHRRVNSEGEVRALFAATEPRGGTQVVHCARGGWVGGWRAARLRARVVSYA